MIAGTPGLNCWSPMFQLLAAACRNIGQIPGGSRRCRLHSTAPTNCAMCSQGSLPAVLDRASWIEHHTVTKLTTKGAFPNHGKNGRLVAGCWILRTVLTVPLLIDDRCSILMRLKHHDVQVMCAYGLAHCIKRRLTW
jgi:hypothetical protein